MEKVSEIKRRSDGSVIEDTRNKYQKLWDKEYEQPLRNFRDSDEFKQDDLQRRMRAGRVHKREMKALFEAPKAANVV